MSDTLSRWLGRVVRGPRARSALVATAAFLLATAVGVGALEVRDRSQDERFDFVAWEIRSIANKWLFALGAPLRDDPPPDEAIVRYFAAADRESAPAARLENVVEAAIEGRIDAAARALGVGDPPLPVPTSWLGVLAVFPPVDVELTVAPRVLVVSPRATIRRARTDVLRPDMTQEEAIALEERAEARDASVAAIVLPTGGIATYPAVVGYRGTYASTVLTAAHEWTHHHLSLYPLGRAFFSSADARTINETVADIVGDELGAHALELFGDPTARAGAGGPLAAAPEPAVSRDVALRDLRLAVDGLLADGRIEEAERRMEQVRLELWEAGIRIRRINQAYFAWFGSYAARADATDPLGGQLRELRDRAGTLDRFIEVVRDLTSRAAVERALADPASGGASGGEQP